ncbi:methyltransferase family protein [Gaoshiqia sp. Z1-71]|uniref:methyltransferase family protein n=1 Tax=Gaoshiqia hydrogeniformans TaxID=3290090 RepID=UPI003BF8AF14
MKKTLSAVYALFCYAIGFLSLLYWIASTGNLFPEASIDGVPVMDTGSAILKNLGLVFLFGIQHTVMARRGFKKWIIRFIPAHLERSTYVLATGIALTLLVWQWEPLGGVIWQVSNESVWYNVLYGMFFTGWVILFISTFLINHFDLFGLRQAYLRIRNEPYKAIDFKVVAFYKYSRHPLYLGTLIGIWSTPLMTVTHLVYSLLLTTYILVGLYYEEKDLIHVFGEQYLAYKRSTPRIIPIKLKQ